MEKFHKIESNIWENHSRKLRLYRKCVVIKNKENVICEHCKTDERVFVYRKNNFVFMLDDFHVKENIDYNKIETYKSRNDWMLIYKNINCLQKWKEYHDKNVEIMFLCPECNNKRINIKDFVFKNCIPLETDDNDCLLYNKEDRKGNKKVILRSMRDSISSFSKEYKKNCVSSLCKECGSKHKIQVDHYKTSFMEIVNLFLEKNNISFFDIECYMNVHTLRKTLKYNQNEIIPQWVSYHNSKVCYRLLCKSCNVKNKTYGFRDKHCKVKKMNEVDISKSVSGVISVSPKKLSLQEHSVKVLSVYKNRKLREIDLF